MVFVVEDKEEGQERGASTLVLVYPLALGQSLRWGSALPQRLANKPQAVIKIWISIKAGKMLDRAILIGHKLKSDDMAWHGSIMAAFVLVGGLFNYLYQLAMGRMLAPAEYGTLISLLSLFLIISVFSQTIQTSITKFTSRFRVDNRLGRINYLWKYSLRRTFLLGVILFLALFLLSPLISGFLNIDNSWYWIIFASSFILSFALAASWGILQGLQRFSPLGISTALVSLLRLGLGIILVYLGLGLYGGLLCLPLAILVAMVLSLSFLKDLAKVGNETVKVDGLFSYAGPALLALTAFAVLTNIDVVLVKHFLSPENAGNYSAISVLGKIVLVAPMGVAVAMFPKTSELFESGGSHRPVMMKAMLLTVVIGGGVLIVYWLFPDFIIDRLFAGKYPLATPYLSKYGLAMAFWAISFLLLNYSLSLNRTKVAYPLLGAMVLQLGLISLFHSSIAQVVDIMLISSIACLALMCPLYLNVRRKHL